MKFEYAVYDFNDRHPANYCEVLRVNRKSITNANGWRIPDKDIVFVGNKIECHRMVCELEKLYINGIKTNSYKDKIHILKSDLAKSGVLGEKSEKSKIKYK